jgi:hypothetical protein
LHILTHQASQILQKSAFLPIITNSSTTNKHQLTIISYQQLLESHESLNITYRQLLNDHEALQKVYFKLEHDLVGQLKNKNLITNSLTHELNLLKVLFIFYFVCF